MNTEDTGSNLELFENLLHEAEEKVQVLEEEFAGLKGKKFSLILPRRKCFAFMLSRRLTSNDGSTWRLEGQETWKSVPCLAKAFSLRR